MSRGPPCCTRLKENGLFRQLRGENRWVFKVFSRFFKVFQWFSNSFEASSRSSKRRWERRPITPLRPAWRRAPEAARRSRRSCRRRSKSPWHRLETPFRPPNRAVLGSWKLFRTYFRSKKGYSYVKRSVFSRFSRLIVEAMASQGAMSEISQVRAFGSPHVGARERRSMEDMEPIHS